MSWNSTNVNTAKDNKAVMYENSEAGFGSFKTVSAVDYLI
jgi:hypothetical protein